MKVSVNRDVCTGHAQCMSCCPEIYGADEYGYCVILREVVPEHLQDAAITGARSCPEGAIKITDA
ncbi:ferredoxin [Burkholderia sp. R-69980]|nr:ferredoxin [Burkholderia sp. R-69980]